MTNASKTVWGVLCNGRIALMKWRINCLEMMAVILAFKEFMTELRGHHVLVCSDNRTVVAFINHQGGTRSCPDWRTGLSYGHGSRVVHVLGSSNIGADMLSHGGLLPREWRLHPLVVDAIWLTFAQADVDLFVTKENSHCQTFPEMASPAPLCVPSGSPSPTGSSVGSGKKNINFFWWHHTDRTSPGSQN